MRNDDEQSEVISRYVGAPYAFGSATSKAAAEAVLPWLSTMRARVLRAIISMHPKGATCDEIEALTGMSHQSASPRLREIEAAGYIVETEEVRLTRSMHKASVYQLTGKPFDESAHPVARKRRAAARTPRSVAKPELRSPGPVSAKPPEAEQMGFGDWIERKENGKGGRP